MQYGFEFPGNFRSRRGIHLAQTQTSSRQQKLLPYKYFFWYPYSTWDRFNNKPFSL